MSPRDESVTELRIEHAHVGLCLEVAFDGAFARLEADDGAGHRATVYLDLDGARRATRWLTDFIERYPR